MNTFSDIVERIRGLLFRRSDERELAEELRFHLDMETEHLRRTGVSEHDARRHSLIALGGVERVKEDVRDARGTRLFQDSGADVSFATRTLRRNPGFALVAILTLAIGIGGTTAVFSVVNAVLLQPLPYSQPGQLVRLYQNSAAHPDDRGFVTPVHYLDYRSRMSSFEAAAAIETYSEVGADIGTGDGVRRIRLLPVTAEYFDIVRVHPEIGRGLQPQDENATVVVVSHSLWLEQLRGDRSAVGKTLTMSGRPYVVAGVMPDGFRDPIVGSVDAWVPVDLAPGRDVSNADNHYFSVIARLRGATPIASSQAELDALSLTLAKQYPSASYVRARLYPLKEDIVGSSSRALEILLGAVALVLLLVCVNIANLMLVRGSERAREFAVRSAIGAGRARLVRQMLIESLTLALAGDVAGLVVARLSMSGIVRLADGAVPRLETLSLDPRLLLFSVVVATACALVFGLAPALRIARTQPGDVLRGQSRSSTGGSAQMRLREWLVVSQVALAFVLLVAAGLLLSSFQRIRDVPLGVAPANVLTFELHLPTVRYDSTRRAAFYDDLAATVAKIPGVRAAGGISRLPATGNYHVWGTQPLTGPLARTPRGDIGAQQRVVAGDYFRAVGIPVIEGRVFDAQDVSGAPDRVVVSQTFARRLFPGMSAVGQRIAAGGRQSDIIGVVGDVSINNEGAEAAYVYHSHRQWAGNRAWALTQVVSLNTSRAHVERPIAGAISAIDQQLVMFKPAMLEDVIGRGAAQRVLMLRILLVFAGVAITLAALGLFGVLSFGVRLRAREFGIRMALGADSGVVRRMVLRKGFAVTAIGLGLGVVGALMTSRLIASVLFHVSPLDPRVMLGSILLMGAIAGLAAYLPARRATQSDPLSVLGSE
jgi:predicted permease